MVSDLAVSKKFYAAVLDARVLLGDLTVEERQGFPRGRRDRLLLADHAAVQLAFHLEQLVALVLVDRRHRHAGPLADHLVDLGPGAGRLGGSLVAQGKPAASPEVQALATTFLGLIALADLVVSAGGTMNREAAALGVPVYTTYGGRLGGVDEELIRQGRLKPLSDPRALDLQKRDGSGGQGRVRRDPAVMLELLLSALG